MNKSILAYFWANYIDEFFNTEEFQYLTDNMPTSFNNNRNPGKTDLSIGEEGHKY